MLAVITRLAGTVRQALGDDTSDSAQRFAMDTLSATSIEVVRDYAAAMDAMSRSRFEEARKGFARAVERDPKFGLAYAGMAIASRNLDDQQDAEKYVQEAVRHLDGMTERERYRTRGMFYYLTNDYQACVKEYGDLLARYSADAAARNNLALCLTHLRDMPRAVEEMRQVVKILPNRTLYRENLALYTAYSGDFAAAAQEVQGMEEPRVFGRLALAFAQLGQGQLTEAAETYRAIGGVDALGESYAVSGLGDLAMYEGRFADAARIFEEGAAADLKANDADRAADKLVALAYADAVRKDTKAAIAAAEQALAHSRTVKIRFLAARVLLECGAVDKARTISATLAAELQAEPQAYAKVIDGLAAMKTGDPRAGDQAADRGQRAPGDMDRPLRAWPGLPRRQRLHPGRFRVRPLPQAAGRGAVTVPGRGTHVQHLPAGLLLPGAGPRRLERHQLRRVLSRVSRHPGKSRMIPSCRTPSRGPVADRATRPLASAISPP